MTQSYGKVIRFGTGLAFALLVVAVSAAARPTSHTLSATPAPFVCQTYCNTNCSDTDYHELVETTFTPQFLDYPHSCMYGDCNTAHIECFADNDDLALKTEEDFRSAAKFIEDAEPRQLREMLDAHGRQITFNADRGAVQISGCGGTILTMVVLTASQLEGLAEIQAQ